MSDQNGGVGPISREAAAEFGALLVELREKVEAAEPWLDKKKLADHYSCGVRSIESAHSEGMPSETIFGRPKFRVSAVERWRKEHSDLRRNVTSTSVASNVNGPGTADTAPGPTTRRNP